MTSIAKWILGLFAVALMAWLVYLYGAQVIQERAVDRAVSSSSQAKGSETYTNNTLGYSFAYPANWRVTSEDDGSVTIEDDTASGDYNVVPEIHGEIRVTTFDGFTKPDYSVEKLLTVLEQGGEDANKPIAEPQYVVRDGSTTVAGEPAILATTGCCGGERYGALFRHGEHIYHIALVARGGESADNRKVYQSVLDQVFATFAFTKAEAGDWQTFTSKRGGFTIQYPLRLAVGPTKVDETWEAPGDNFDYVVFGPPSSREGGYIWGVFFDKKATELEKIVADQGSQFLDREVKREDILVDGQSAVLVTAKTDSEPKWVSKVVYIPKGDKLYQITNGAIDAPEFETFYKSFRFTN